MKYALAVIVFLNMSTGFAQIPKALEEKRPTKKSAATSVEKASKADSLSAPVNLLTKPFTIINYHSDPEGAEIRVIERGRDVGRASQSSIYTVADFEKNMRADGCVYVMPMEAKWLSGATARGGALGMCDGTSRDYDYTFVRPKDAPSIEKDENFAATLKAERERVDKSLGQFTVVLKTVPEGAEVFEVTSSGRHPWGRSPVRLKYEIFAQKRIAGRRQDGCMPTMKFEAHWPSGAKSTIESLSLCGEMKAEETRVIDRPVGMPGLEVDQNFAAALILERIRKENNDQQALQAQRAQEQAQIAREQANQAQQRLAQEAQRQAEQDAFDNKAAAIINGLLLGISQRQPEPVVIERRQAPTELRCVTRPRFGRLDTVCE